MAEEMLIENAPWESDEAEDWESDEALAEADESVDDIGERTRRRRRRNRFRPARGVQGLRLPGQDGRARTIAFPAKLTTTDETNRGLATQELGRRELEQRLISLEARARAERRSNSTVSGVVTLTVGGGLTAFSLIRASQQAGDGSIFQNWAKQDAATMATLTSVTQLAHTGANLLVNGRYHRSGVGMAADAFATVQIATFAIASLYQPAPPPKFTTVDDEPGLKKAQSNGTEGDLIYATHLHQMLVLRRNLQNTLTAIPQ